MRRRIKTESMRVVLRLAVGLMMSLFVLVLNNAQNVEGSNSHKGRFHKAKSLNCGDMITSHAVLYNDLDCSDYSEGSALTLEEGASLNLNGKKIIGNDGKNCIEIIGDGAKVLKGTVMNGRKGIQVTGNRNEVIEVEVRDNDRTGIDIISTENNKANSNKIYHSIVQNNGREGIYIEGGNGNKIYHSIVDNNGRQGIRIEGNNNKIFHNVVDNNGRHGIQIGGNGNEIYGSTVRGSCRDGIEISGNDNSVFNNNVEDNGNSETCDPDDDYNPWAYAGIDIVSPSANNKIKYNYACGNQGCNGSKSCIERERNFWDENADIDGNCVSTNEWKDNTVCPECTSPPED